MLAFPLLFASAAHAQTHPGQEQLVREVAKDTGKSKASLNALLDGAKKQQAILDAISRPAEGKPWRDYRPIFLTEQRIEAGADFYREHRKLLDGIGRKYGVPPEYIVAIVGVETFYGRNTGKWKVIDALTTLAFYYPKRAPFFREQLKALLELPQNHLGGPIDTLTGSYAGAQGWGQFMPSSIRDWGVDYDGDGRIDMKGSMGDIFASVANYFKDHGWETGGPIAMRAQPDRRAVAPAVPKDWRPVKPIEAFVADGFAPLKHVNPGRDAQLVRLDGPNGDEYWFTFQNFYVITTYNRSPMYAMAVDQLAQEIRARVNGPASR
ncbi:membrane-bound lytic murein transglycosylase B [Luteibacter sp. UNCMF331Sha3.1]|uniref:lytic murein transglycosylase B n=1 Tax=Luteibacter sp. UNCMF331Sha3.1 TaxID=1502760 RepID=UPI0008BF5052|nr:lytic murein transglycosylase B [Luteibacter sp. UNCMF331Sha3.1]SEM78385.1 membrane-bound lytic murein transglycosylase B [Luteibacter sp. UNCMF331Sha3.1]